jgi:hypothetical protein
MRYSITSIALLFLVGCHATGARDENKNPTATCLKPNPALCFATPAATQFIIGVVGEDWAIQFTVPRDGPKLPTGVLSTRNVSFYRGPEIHKYIRPSAGPPTPPLPKTDAYSVVTLTNVTIKSVGGRNGPGPDGYLEITLSKFAAGGEWFKVSGKVRLPFRGPYP